MEWKDHIDIDPAVLVGKPVIKGTRIAVEFIMDLLAQGWSEQNIFENYPGITHEDVISCLRYTEQIIKTERIYALDA